MRREVEGTGGVGIPVGGEREGVNCGSTGEGEGQLFVGEWCGVIADWGGEEERKFQEEEEGEKSELHVGNLWIVFDCLNNSTIVV